MPKGDYSSNKDVKAAVNYPLVRDLTLNIIEMAESHALFQRPDQYPDAIVPESMVPGSREHALLIFYACSIDSMRRAETVYQALRKISEKTDLRELHRLSEVGLELLFESHLDNLKMGNPIQTVLTNSRQLHERYKGDPRNIAGKARTREEIEAVQARIQEFSQYGLGKSALLMKNFVRFGCWDFPEPLLPVKVDRHAIRISLGTQAVQFYNNGEQMPIAYQDLPKIGKIRSESLVRLLQPAFQDATEETQTSAIKLDDAMWLLGSRMCHRNNATYCSINCSVNCISRPLSDNTATVFLPGTEKRKHKKQQALF